MRIIDHIVIHTAAGTEPGRKFHRLIATDGRIRIGCVDLEPCSERAVDARALRVCCAGAEPLTRAQLDSLVAQCSVWVRLHGVDVSRVVGAGEAAGAGPGMARVRARVRGELAGVSRGLAPPSSSPEAGDEAPPTVRTRR
jgi:hypothetical protein